MTDQQPPASERPLASDPSLTSGASPASGATDASAASGPTPATHGKPGVKPELVLTAALVALVFAISTWLLASRQIGQLRSELTSLQAAHRELALQATQGRRGGTGAVGQTIDVAGAPADGNANATVTLIEFSDYECPFCIRHFKQTMPQIHANYVQTGKIRYVFKDFPIDQLHPQAIRGHEAAGCAKEQGKFWEMHGRMFSPGGTHTPSQLEERAAEAGLDLEAFRACIASGRMTPLVRQSASVVQALGATGTPWFVVGVRDPKTDQVRVVKSIGGAQPYDQFALALDAALKDAAAN